MGMFDFITGKGTSDKAIEKHVARAKNKDAQSVDRFESLEILVGHAGSGELRSKAVLGLLGRFTIRYDKGIEDEQEKDYVFEQLRHLGSSILPEVEQHMHTAESIAWGLKLLGEVANQEEAWPILDRLCERNDNNYTRDPSKKNQLVHFLGEHADPRGGIALIPYLEDVDEGVRFTTVEGILRHKPEEAKRPLLALLASDREQSRRVKKRIVEGLSETGWDVRGDAPELMAKLVADLMPGGKIDKEGRVRRAAAGEK